MPCTSFIFACATLLAFFAQGYQSALAATLLTTMNRTDETTSLQLYFRFSAFPEYEITQNKRRVDLLIKNTLPTDTLVLPSSDERIIRSLSKKQDGNTLLSFFFRYPPQKITQRSRQKPATLMLDFLLGNQFTTMYPDLSNKLEGLTLLDRDTIDYTNPVYVSPYAEKWISFFTQYETPVIIDPPITYTLPPFPLAKHLNTELEQSTWLNEVTLKDGEAGNWSAVAFQLKKHIESETNEEIKDLQLFTYGEALVRGDEYREAYPLLQHIIARYENTQTAALAQFLFTFLRSKHEPDFLTSKELAKAVDQIDKSLRIHDYLTILLAETLIKEGKYEKALEQLQRDDIGFNQYPNMLRQMRLADIFCLQNKQIKALVTYLNIEGLEPVIQAYPESLAKFSNLVYVYKRYAHAGKLYQLLTNQLNGKRWYTLSLFRTAMSELHNEAPEQQVEQKLYQIQEAFSNTEGAYRAMLKQADLKYLSGVFTPAEALKAYENMALNANTTDLREEAMLKQALVHHLNGDQEAAVRQAMQLLREFQSGKLRTEAKAIIIQQLPEVTKQLVKERNYLDALILAQQNRSLFTRGWISSTMLYDLATAYSDLGFFDRSARTYQYLFATSSDQEQEQIYLPLIKSLFQDGQYAALEDYADRFSFRYPYSQYGPKIFYYRLKSLVHNRQLEQAAALLENTKRPVSADIERLAMGIYYELEQWQEIVKRAELEASIANDPDTQKMMIFAEAYFRTGTFEKAQPLYQAITKHEKKADQALFRLAQIAFKKNNIEQALNRFEEIAEKGEDPLWKKLAQEEIAIIKLQQGLQ